VLSRERKKKKGGRTWLLQGPNDAERERERARDPQTQTGSKQDGKGKENCDGGGIAGIWNGMEWKKEWPHFEEEKKG
jgi:hypothetical protein